jgi:hypothetical protein
MTKIPKQKFNYGAPSTEGDIPPLEITDVQPLLEHLAAIRGHLASAWATDELPEAMRALSTARVALVEFRELEAIHRERILGE